MKLFEFLSKKPVEKVVEQETYNILVIDDNKEFIELLQDWGRPHPQVNIIYALSGLEGVQVLKTQKIHGILADVEMPDMNFLDKQLENYYGDMPVYRMSGTHFKHLNISITKPFNREKYFSKIKEIAGMARIIAKVA